MRKHREYTRRLCSAYSSSKDAASPACAFWMASASPAIGGLRRKCWLGAFDGAVGPGVVAMSLFGIDIGTSRKEVRLLRCHACGRIFAFSIEHAHKVKRGLALGSR